jgi:Mg-chelatase subunit ChlD
MVSVEQLEDCVVIVMSDGKEYEVEEYLSDIVAELKEIEEREEQIALVNNMTVSMLGQAEDS